MKKLAPFLSMLLAALVSAAWVVKETKLNEDLSFYVNSGGVQTKALELDGATATLNTTTPMMVDLTASGVGLTIQGASGQTSAPAFTVENSGGTDQFTVAPNGQVVGNNTANFNGTVTATAFGGAHNQLVQQEKLNLANVGGGVGFDFGGTGGSTNSNQWMGLVAVQMHSDTTNAAQYLYSMMAHGTSGFGFQVLHFFKGTSPVATDPACSPTRSGTVISMNCNGVGAIKSISVIWQNLY